MPGAECGGPLEAESGHARLLRNEIPGPKQDTYGRHWRSPLTNTSVKPWNSFVGDLRVLHSLQILCIAEVLPDHADALTGPTA